MPAYTIIVPAYNAEATIGRAVESVLAQKPSDWTLLVVDDGSTDRTGETARAYARADDRITVLRQDNMGVAAARNAGIAASDTEFVVFLDADDELSPDYLSMMHAFVDANPGYDIYHPNLTILQGDWEESLFLDAPEPVSFTFEDLLQKCVIAVGGACVRMSLFERIGGFRTGIHCEDYDLWLRATAQGAKPLFLPTPLYLYHQVNPQRRSANASEGLEGLIVSLNRLVDENLAPPGTLPQIRRAIAKSERQITTWLEEKAVAEAFPRQAAELRSRLESALGPGLARVVLRAVHSVTWMTRPLRKAIAERRAARSRRLGA